MGVIDDLARAREAYERRDWVAAYDALSGTPEADLAADDFLGLAQAALLVGRTNDAVQALQRAYQAYVDGGDVGNAVRCTFFLAMTLMSSREPAIAGGWVARGQRLLADVEDDIVERGYLLSLVMFQHIFSGQFEPALAMAEEITEYGRRFGDPDLFANGLNAQGRMLLYTGRVREGLALLDEAMVGIATGEVSPVFAGQIYCSLIEACQEVSDYGRAAEWTSALTAWIDEQPGLVMFTGQCAVHRGQIMRLHGAYDSAVDEFERAVERYVAADTLPPAGLAMSEWADVLRIRGDLAGAGDAYDRAIGFGHEPQPGLALLWLARDRTDSAAAAIRRLLGQPLDPVHRSRLLPGSVEVLLAADDVEAAASVAAELASTAESFGCRGLLAMAGHASGAVLLAQGDPSGALHVLRRASREWQALDAPYDAARSRELVGLALRALGDADSAGPELAAAAATFDELGAVPDARRLAALTRPPLLPGGLTEREVEVLRLVATGRSNPEIAATLVLSEKTVARHLSNIFGKLEVTSRTAAAAYAFEHGLL